MHNPFSLFKKRQDGTDIHCKVTVGQKELRVASSGVQYKEES